MKRSRPRVHLWATEIVAAARALAAEGATQKSIAAALKISQPSVCRVLRGRR